MELEIFQRISWLFVWGSVSGVVLAFLLTAVKKM